jgi:hypothetical protein
LHPKVIKDMIERIGHIGGTVVQDPGGELTAVTGGMESCALIGNRRQRAE